jgi:predicted Zn finger-like uncharacterized protein
MILTCPQCATRYQVEADKFPASGRNVRCSKCGHVWHQLGPMPDPDTEIESREPNASANSDAESTQPSMAAEAPLRPLRPAADETDSDTTRGSLLGRVAIASGWLLLVALVLAIGWTAVVMRDSVATWLPQTSSLYAAVGLPVNPRGMDFTGVAYQKQMEDGQIVLAVSGNIVNRSAHELTVPLVRVALFDGDKHELYHWTFVAGVTTLKPGEATRFRTRLSSPPAGTHDLEVRFARDGE